MNNAISKVESTKTYYVLQSEDFGSYTLVTKDGGFNSSVNYANEATQFASLRGVIGAIERRVLKWGAGAARYKIVRVTETPQPETRTVIEEGRAFAPEFVKYVIGTDERESFVDARNEPGDRVGRELEEVPLYETAADATAALLDNAAKHGISIIPMVVVPVSVGAGKPLITTVEVQ